MTRELRTVQFMKIISLAPEVLTRADGFDMNKIRKGDNVVSSAATRAARRRHRQVLDDHVVVESVNRVKRAPNPQASRQGGIVERRCRCPSPGRAVQPGTQKADRVGFKTFGRRQARALAKSNGEVLDA